MHCSNQTIPQLGQADAKRSRSPRRSSRPSPWFRAGNLVRRLRWRGYRLPPRDDPHTLPPSNVVGDEREVPAQLDDGGQLPVLIEHAANRRGCLFVHTEHRCTMRRRTGTGKQNAVDARPGSAASVFQRRQEVAAPCGAAGLGKAMQPSAACR